jgi:hypothetical protein
MLSRRNSGGIRSGAAFAAELLSCSADMNLVAIYPLSMKPASTFPDHAL